MELQQCLRLLQRIPPPCSLHAALCTAAVRCFPTLAAVPCCRTPRRPNLDPRNVRQQAKRYSQTLAKDVEADIVAEQQAVAVQQEVWSKKKRMWFWIIAVLLLLAGGVAVGIGVPMALRTQNASPAAPLPPSQPSVPSPPPPSPRRAAVQPMQQQPAGKA